MIDIKMWIDHWLRAPQLIIRVIDENNNSPLFVESSRNLAVPETAQIGQSIATLIATDKDVGLNGEISYSLESVDQPDSALGESYSIWCPLNW